MLNAAQQAEAQSNMHFEYSREGGGTSCDRCAGDACFGGFPAIEVGGSGIRAP
jgi:hypothetical protein